MTSELHGDALDGSGESRSILVIEDDADIRESLKQAFEDEGYAVRTAANGREGMERLRAGRPRVVVLDLMMPVMNGREFLAWLHSDPELRDLPVIILSAWEREAARVPGDPVFIRKPFELDFLLACVQQHF